MGDAPEEPREEVRVMDGSEIERFGLYRLYWTSGGSSLAAVGGLHDRRLWFAPTNWTADDARYVTSSDWNLVERAELLVTWGGDSRLDETPVLVAPLGFEPRNAGVKGRCLEPLGEGAMPAGWERYRG